MATKIKNKHEKMLFKMNNWNSKPLFYAFTLACLISFGAFGQTAEAKLILLDGTTFEGYGKITKNDKILFRMDLEDEPDKWGSDQVKRIEFDDYFQIIAYEFVKAGNSRSTLLRVIEPGFMTLYAFDETYWTPNMPIGNDLINESKKVSTTSYYIKRTDKDFMCPVVRNKKAWKRN